MKLPNQAKPVARFTTSEKDRTAAVLPSDCCGAGECCLGTCLFGKCVGACVPNIGQCCLRRFAPGQSAAFQSYLRSPAFPPKTR